MPLLRTSRTTLALAVVAVVTAAGLVAALGFARPVSPAPASLAGRPAPALTIAAPSGAVSVGSFEGRPLVLNFFASWCTSCAAEAPALASASREHPEVGFLGAAIQDTSAGAAAFVSGHQLPYPAGPIVGGSYLRYGVTGPPETFFIDRQGRIADHFVGPLDRATLDAYLARLDRG